MFKRLQSIAQIRKLPSTCPLCNQYHHESLVICGDCRALLHPLGYHCSHCALPLPQSEHPVCGHCIKQKPYFDKIYTAYLFKEPLRTLIHEFKYRQSLYLSAFMAHLILDAISPLHLTASCLLPVPMHPKNIKSRGYNHAAELAKYLARYLRIPCHLTDAKKISHTPNQASLGLRERQTNLKNAFLVRNAKQPHVVIIDDLVTTGSTVNELARLLKQKGASRVDVFCCARASL